MTQKPLLPGHALDLAEYPDFESCLVTYLAGSPGCEARVFEALLATVVSGFRHNGWTAQLWLSFLGEDKTSVNRLAFAAAYFFRRCYPKTPGERTAQEVLTFCKSHLYDPWPDLFIGNIHRPDTPFADEAHVHANIVLPGFDKKIAWDMDRYCYVRDYHK